MQLFQIFKGLSIRPDFSKGCVVLSLPPLIDKLGDMKLSKLVAEVLESFAENTSVGFLLSSSFELATQQKSPKVVAEYVKNIQDLLTTFGTAGVSLKKLIDFLKSTANNSNPQVRTAVFGALTQLRIFIGPGIVKLLDDLPTQQLSIIQAEFDKVKDAVPTTATKTQKVLTLP
jgi:cytoskeleton-associated protein 5